MCCVVRIVENLVIAKLSDVPSFLFFGQSYKLEHSLTGVLGYGLESLCHRIVCSQFVYVLRCIIRVHLWWRGMLHSARFEYFRVDVCPSFSSLKFLYPLEFVLAIYLDCGV